MDSQNQDTATAVATTPTEGSSAEQIGDASPPRRESGEEEQQPLSAAPSTQHTVHGHERQAQRRNTFSIFSSRNLRHSWPRMSISTRDIDDDGQAHSVVASRDLTFTDIEMGELIGEGFFGRVYKAWHKGAQRTIVLKQLKQDHEQRASFLREITILQSFNHPNILEYLGLFCHDHKLHLATEYIDGGTLASLLRNVTEKLTWKIKAKLALDLASGMAHIHSTGILHRDLKSENCMVRLRDLSVVIVDFGHSTFMKDESTRSETAMLRQHTGNQFTRKRISTSDVLMNPGQRIPVSNEYVRVMSVVGSCYWMAPEVLKGMYGFKADVFAFGIVLCEIIACISADPDELPRCNNFGLAENDFSEIVLNMPAFKEASKEEKSIATTLMELAFQSATVEPQRRPTFPTIQSELIKLDFFHGNQGEKKTGQAKELRRSLHASLRKKKKGEGVLCEGCEQNEQKEKTNSERGAPARRRSGKQQGDTTSRPVSTSSTQHMARHLHRNATRNQSQTVGLASVNESLDECFDTPSEPETCSQVPHEEDALEEVQKEEKWARDGAPPLRQVSSGPCDVFHEQSDDDGAVEGDGRLDFLETQPRPETAEATPRPEAEEGGLPMSRQEHRQQPQLLREGVVNEGLLSAQQCFGNDVCRTDRVRRRNRRAYTVSASLAVVASTNTSPQPSASTTPTTTSTSSSSSSSSLTSAGNRPHMLRFNSSPLLVDSPGSNNMATNADAFIGVNSRNRTRGNGGARKPRPKHDGGSRSNDITSVIEDMDACRKRMSRNLRWSSSRPIASVPPRPPSVSNESPQLWPPRGPLLELVSSDTFVPACCSENSGQGFQDSQGCAGRRLMLTTDDENPRYAFARHLSPALTHEISEFRRVLKQQIVQEIQQRKERRRKENEHATHHTASNSLADGVLSDAERARKPDGARHPTIGVVDVDDVVSDNGIDGCGRRSQSRIREQGAVGEEDGQAKSANEQRGVQAAEQAEADDVDRQGQKTGAATETSGSFWCVSFI